jgi:hypothetical protein
MASHEVILYTCVLANRDRPKRIEFKDDGFRYVLFTDTPDIYAPDWEIRPSVVGSLADPTRISRYHKHHPFELFPQAECAVWLDATHWPYQSLRPLVDSVSHIASMRHQVRTKVKDEAEECMRHNMDSRRLFLAQMEQYEAEGFPDDLGLYSTSCLVMRKTPEFDKLSSFWWDQICRYSRRDQISLPYASWKTGVVPQVIPGVDRDGYSPFFKMISHYKKFTKLM